MRKTQTQIFLALLVLKYLISLTFPYAKNITLKALPQKKVYMNTIRTP